MYEVEKTLYTYNALGAVTQITDPTGRVTKFNYAANLQDLNSVQQQVGTAFQTMAQYTYNADHQPLTVKKGGETTTYAYNAVGQVKTAKNALNQITTFNYEIAAGGYLANVDGPNAGTTDTVSFTYDVHRNVSTVVQPDGYTTTYETDNLDRVTKLTYPDATFSQIYYELLSATWVRDREGRWSRSWFDGIARTVATMDSQNQVTQYEWCACGSLRGLLDPDGRKTMWFRDIAGRPTKKLYEDGQAQKQVELYSYQPYSGRSQDYTDPDGRVTRWSYFVDGFKAKVDYPGSLNTMAVTYIYNAYYPRLTSWTDETGTTALTYSAISNTVGNGEGLVKTIASPIVGTVKSTITLTYDALSRVTTTDINAQDTVRTFDALGRTSRVVNPLGRFDAIFAGNTSRVEEVQYRTTSAATTFKTIADYVYDTVGNDSRVMAIINNNQAATQAQLSRFDYTYRSDGTIQTWKQDQASIAGGAREWAFGYDGVDQLTSAVRRNPVSGAITASQGYRYDRSGNRTLGQKGGVAQSVGFNAVNQVTTLGGGLPDRVLVAGKTNEPANVTVAGQPTTVGRDGVFRAWVAPTSGTTSVPIVATDASGNATSKTLSFSVTAEAARSFVYDKTGNLLSDGLRTYTWDAAGRLKTVTLGTVTTEWMYDGLSRRVAEKQNGTVIKRWAFCGMLPCEERNAAGTVTKRFYNEGFTTVSGTTVTKYFYTRDHLGSIREVFDKDGVVRAAYDYDIYGKRAANAVTTSPIEADFGFTSHYHHAASGLIYAPYRAYDADSARWISRDPLREAGGMNLYAYCGGDPVNMVGNGGQCA